MIDSQDFINEVFNAVMASPDAVNPVDTTGYCVNWKLDNDDSKTAGRCLVATALHNLGFNFDDRWQALDGHLGRDLSPQTLMVASFIQLLIDQRPLIETDSQVIRGELFPWGALSNLITEGVASMSVQYLSAMNSMGLIQRVIELAERLEFALAADSV